MCRHVACTRLKSSRGCAELGWQVVVVDATSTVYALPVWVKDGNKAAC